MNYSKQLCILCEIQPKIVQDNNLNDIEVYPDFTSPNNFTKLFNLKYQENGYEQALIRLVLSHPVVVENTKDCLKNLIEILQNDENKLSRDKIKRAIKHKKWEIAG